MATSTFPVNPELTAIAIGYRNTEDKLIADSVLPRIPTAKKFVWTSYTQQDGFTVPDTKVGRKSEPTMLDFGGTQVNDEVIDYGLDDLVPNDDIEAWAAQPRPASGGPLNPLSLSTMQLTGLVQLDREVRVAARVFNTSSYVSGQFTTLSGTGQWSDFTNSNPLNAILTALDIPLVRPNKMIIGQQAWTVLRQHPRVIQGVFKSAQTGGTVTRQQIAELLELDEILVGQGFVNTARKGQTPVYSRVWGKHCSLIYSSISAAQMMQPTFGFTAQFGTRVAGEIPEPKVGLRGGQRVRSGESVKEVISAPGVGYYFQNCVA